MTNIVTWLYLLIAIVTEVAGITCMKLSNGFTKWQPSLFILLFYTLSLSFLMLTLKRLPVSFAYAIWSGVGTLLIFFIGVIFFQEDFTMLKIISLIAIISGVLGLRQG